MDRSLDEIVAERNQSNSRSRRPPPRRNNYPRDGVRKPARDDRADLDRDWVHDRYDDDRENNRYSRGARTSRRDEHDGGDRHERDAEMPAKLRVDNLHWDVSEKELRALFEDVGSVVECRIVYDRAGRSNGTAFVTYEYVADARSAIREYDGANAKGQPIKLTLLPSAPAGGRGRAQNPLLGDRVEKPPRSLFDRVERPRSASPGGERDDSRSRRRGPPPGRERRSDTSRAAPDNIDRYIPGKGDRSPIRRPRGADGRRPGQRRDDSRRNVDEKGRKLVGGRPRMTADELDAEMADYWRGKEGQNGDSENTVEAAPASVSAADQSTSATLVGGEDDIDMIE